MKILTVAVASLVAAGMAFAEEAADGAAPAPAETPSEVRFRAGGDFRLRQEAFDNIPLKTAEPAVTRGGNNNYFRYRTRLVGGVDVGDVFSFNARAANEFRTRNTGLESYEWPDELILDQFNIRLTGLFDDRVDLTVGRQDVVLGSGRLFAEGTAKDGSRTQYFDGALARVRLAEKRTLDLFGFYGSCEDDFAVGHEHRDLTGLAGGYNDMDEISSGFFFDDRTLEDFGFGLYYVWKRHTSWRRPSGDRMGAEDIHTAGARLLPKFSEEVSAEFEGAFQWSGSDGYDRRAGFGFGGLRYSFAPATYVSANFLWLSGDDADTARREDFDTLYGRYPWISELMIYAFDGDGVGTWHNLEYAYAEVGHAWGSKGAHRVKATFGQLFAPERDGAGGGDERGWLGTFFYSFPLSSANGITGHLFLDVLEPGDYYVSDKTAYFFRWQVNFAF